MKRFTYVLLGVWASYFLLGKLGLILAIPPGYATSVWPPSGIAVAATLLFGLPALLGTFLGSFTLNLNLSLLEFAPPESIDAYALAFTIAAGAALQAYLGRALIQKKFSYPYSLEDIKSVVQFLFLIGPLSCLLSASIGTLALLLAEKITLSSFFSSWLHWWAGDSIGVLVFAPLSMTFFVKDALWQKRRYSVAAPLLILFTLVSVFLTYSTKWEQERINLLFQQKATSISKNLQTSFDAYIGSLNTLKVAEKTISQMNREQFKKLANYHLENLDGIHALGWNRYLSHKERGGFVASVRQSGILDYEIKDKKKEGGLEKAAVHPHYVAVEYIEPLLANRKALGLNIYSNPKRRLAIERAIREKRAITTDKISLVQGTKKENGILLLSPSFDEKNKIKGFMVGVFKIDKMVESVLKDKKEGLDFHLIDSKGKNAAHEFFTTNKDSKPLSFYENLAKSHHYVPPFSKEFAFAGKKLTIYMTMKPSEYLKQQSWATYWSLAGGLFFTAVFGILLLVLTGQGQLLEKKVKERTIELNEAKDKAVQGEIAKSEFLANMSHELRTPLNAIIGYSEIIHEDAPVDSPLNIKQDSKRIHESGMHLLGLINQVLDISKISSGKLDLMHASFSMCEFVDSLKTLITPMVDKRQNTLKVEYEKGDFISDQVRIRQILLNLLSNAAKFTENGIIHLKIGFKIKEGHKMLFVEVSDTGIGIARENTKKIFDKFTQVHDIYDDILAGTGLGLPIVKSLVELLGGKIDLESKVGEGSIFKVELPQQKIGKKEDKGSEKAA